MKRHLTVALCAFALAGAAFAQDSTNKPSAAWSAKEANRHPRRSLETRVPGPALVPVGTSIRIRLERPLSTSRNHVGDKFYGHVTEPVRVNDRTLIPAGSTVSGFIDRKSQPRRLTGHPSLRLRPEKIVLPGGASYEINASVVDSGNPRRNKVNEEGQIRGSVVSSNEKIETVALTGTGAVAGAVVAGPAGSLIGAAAGATISAGHYMVKRHYMELPTGTVLILELNAPVHLASAGFVSAATSIQIHTP
jgi:hypothetical protein